MPAQAVEGEQDSERGTNQECASASPSKCPVQWEMLKENKGANYAILHPASSSLSPQNATQTG